MASSARETVRQLRARAVGEVADAARLPTGGGSPLAEVGVAGPGFMNLRLAPTFWQGALAPILAAGADWGRAAPRAGARILLEYRSANPTGPIPVAHGRHAAVGDALVRLLRFARYPVTSELYVNDAGVAAPEAMGRAGGDETTTKEDDG